MVNDEKLAKTIEYQYYELDRRYKGSDDKTVGTNLKNMIDQARDFFNGKQFRTANISNNIRVQMNICKLAVEQKASKICGTPIYITFTSDNENVDCVKLRQFDEYNQNKIHLRSFSRQSAFNAQIDGTEIAYVRWDEDDTSYKGIYKGGLVLEHIDPRNFAVANPYLDGDAERCVQNQKWIMFWKDMEVKAVASLIEGSKETKKDKISKLYRQVGAVDDSSTEYDKVSHSLIRVFTRYFRVDGEVYFTCSTDYVEIFEYPKPLNRRLHKAKIKKIVDEFKKKQNEEQGLENGDVGDLVSDYEIDYENIIMPAYKNTKLSDDEYKNIKEKFSLYPFAIYESNPVAGSFYGKSDISNLIPIQKGLNYLIGMTLKCAENNAFNKVLVKPDALQGQQITSEPGQVITDYSGFTNSWGIQLAGSQPIPNSLFEFAINLFELSRKVYGFTEVMDGTITNQDISGYAMAQMIKQSNTNIEQQQLMFFEFHQNLAAIRLMYYKHYVDKAKFTHEKSEMEYESDERARLHMYNYLASGKQSKAFPEAKAEDFATPTHKVNILDISGDELYGTNFDIAIDVMQGTADSKVIEQQTFDNLTLNGALNNMDADTLNFYISCSPSLTARTRAEMKKAVELKKNSEISMLKQQLQDLTNKTLQVVDYAQKLEAQLNVTTKYASNMAKEFKNKINASNRVTEGMFKELDAMKRAQTSKTSVTPQKTLSPGEVKSNNSRGIEGTTSQ